MFKRFSWKRDAKSDKVEIPRFKIKSSHGHNESVISEPQQSRSRAAGERSFGIPEGLPMDPLAPTALAVSTEFMGHLGNSFTLLRDHTKKIQKYVLKNRGIEALRRSWKSIVSVVLIEAKDLPDVPDTPATSLYCKLKLGTETQKSKRVSKSKSIWRETFNLHLYDDTNLEITVWHKGKVKNFMGRCMIDLNQLEKDKTHDLWQDLECGYGKIHLLVTISGIVRRSSLDNVPTTLAQHSWPAEDKFLWYRLDDDWTEVGQLSVTVHSARGLCSLGLSNKTDAYCVLEVDNSKVQTHTVRCTSDPIWNKSYVFGIHDITSTLDIAVYDESFITSIKGELLGKVSIPLLRINHYKKRWYALKDREKKGNARGNCPRILLEMSIVWNPIKASARVLRPKETKYIQKSPKFDIPLLYNNLKAVNSVFSALYNFNEYIKYSFEWESRDRSLLALITWLIFWMVFRIWMAPLLLLIPFLYHWPTHKDSSVKQALIAVNHSSDEESDDEDYIKKENKTIKNHISGLQDLTFGIKNGVDFLISLLERVNNLTRFTVPYLSYLVMIAMVGASAALYFIPINYIFMALGIYKYMRKYLNPKRTPNNDILDFISRVPDNEILKEWRELKVPEPNVNTANTNNRDVGC